MPKYKKHKYQYKNNTIKNNKTDIGFDEYSIEKKLNNESE